MGVMPHFGHHRPRSLDEVLTLLARFGEDARLIAGGTDLVLQMKAGVHTPAQLISLNGVHELRGITWSSDAGLRIGAGARVSEVGAYASVRADYPGLAEACSVMATTQVRHMATVAGNIVNGSSCADTSAPLLVYDARVEIVGPDASRAVPLSQFFLAPKRVDLRQGEVVVALQLPPRPPRSGSDYQRLSARSKVDMAAASVAGMLRLDEQGVVREARVAMAAVGPTPLRSPGAEALLIGKKPESALLEAAAAACAADARPIDDVRATAQWRRHVTGVMARRVLIRCVERAQLADQEVAS